MSVPVNVKVFETVNVLRFAIVKIPLVLVTVNPLYVFEVRADGISAFTIALNDGVLAEPFGDAKK